MAKQVECESSALSKSVQLSEWLGVDIEPSHGLHHSFRSVVRPDPEKKRGKTEVTFFVNKDNRVKIGSITADIRIDQLRDIIRIVHDSRPV